MTVMLGWFHGHGLVESNYQEKDVSQMAKAKKKFDEDFKKMIVDLNQSGQSIEFLAEQYGLAVQTIYRWKELYTKNETTGMTEAEILAIKK